MGTLPLEVRAAIVRLRHDQKLEYEDIAAALGVGRASVSRVLRRHRELGDVAPFARGGGNHSVIRGRVAELLRSIVASMPDATLLELAAALQRRARVSASESAVGRALKRLGYSKKSPRSSRPKGTRPSTGRGAAPSAR